MAEHRLYDHYTDLSSESGFQFEFYCERCPEAWRSPFVRYAAGRLPAAIDAASRLMAPRNASARGVATFRGEAWDRARDAAFRNAARMAAEHFHHCPECRCHCCPGCWSAASNRCTGCAPRDDQIDPADAELSASPALAGAMAYRPLGRHCSACGRLAGAASFCPHCGAGLGEKHACRTCRKAIPAAARFCPSCGERTGR